MEKSTNPDDYQDLDQPVSVMRKEFADGHLIEDHAHRRDQFLFSITGIMRLKTADGTWIVPPEGAAYIPGGLVHSVAIFGNVDMRTLYINRQVRQSEYIQNADQQLLLPEQMKVLVVSDLLRELILALCSEPLQFGRASRGALLSQLIIWEISQAKELMLHVPLPRDSRLQTICAELMGRPSDNRTLEEWSQICGASSRTLARLFERELGMSFGQWRQNIRFQSAYEALLKGNSVQQVAYDNGYNSPSAFTAAFTRALGISPSLVGST